MSHRRRLSHVLVLIALVLLLTGLTVGITASFATDASPSPADKIVLHVGWTSEPDNLNPFIGYEGASWEIWHLNYDFLVGFRASDLQPVPELATSWSHDATGRVWTFKLRQDATWQDGVPVTARDVAWTFNTIIDNQIANFTSYTGFITKVVAVDDYTVKIICSRPKANILGMLVYVLPEHIWSKIPPAALSKTFQNKPPIIGSGPFQVVEWKKGSFVRMVKNPSYWGQKAKVDEIVFSFYQNENNMVEDLKTGAIQVAWLVPGVQYKALQSAPGLKAILADVNGYTELGFNCYTGKGSLGNPVLKDWRFRQALQWAIDRQRVVEFGWEGLAKPATTIIRPGYYPPSLDYHWQPPADELYTYDPNKAKEALDAAGYKDTDGDGIRNDPKTGKDIALRLFTRTQSTQEQRAGKLVAGWLQDVGLRISLQIMDQGAMTDKMYNYVGNTFAPDYDMFIWYWQSDPDPDWVLAVLTSSQIEGWSDSNWSNAQYDALYAQQQTTIDPQARKQIIWQMQQVIYEQTPYIPLVYMEWPQAYNDSQWTGWIRSPANVGGVTRIINNIDTYLSVHPAPAAAPATSSTSWIWGVVVVVVAAAIVVAVVVRRRRRPEEEA
jgi:peptide/nickel transport system substrate-binding protein